MNKKNIKRYAKLILEDVENAEHIVERWVKYLVEEIENTPAKLKEKIALLEERFFRVNNKPVEEEIKYLKEKLRKWEEHNARQ